MGITELFILAIGLAMDAFAVSICKGLATNNVRIKHMILAGIWFGGFQALMPVIGYFLGSAFAKYITSIDHWIAFALLALIGINMIREAFQNSEEEVDDSFSVKTMLIMAVATSIDALAIGVSFAFLLDKGSITIAPAAACIGIVTFLLSAVGVKVGSVFGSKLESKAEIIGGIMLICLGIKILLEHLGVFSM
ncbi:MAG: manganese efflux pump MntP family protein [Lachnospiraceae bacterium]